jgi:ferric-dicitrate binding protein FerR (iron transport regulator)
LPDSVKRRWNVKMIALASFGAVAAVAAALGCPVFRNPANYLTAGGAIGYLKHVVDVHRRH